MLWVCLFFVVFFSGGGVVVLYGLVYVCRPCVWFKRVCVAVLFCVNVVVFFFVSYVYDC